MRWRKLQGALGAECSATDLVDVDIADVKEALLEHQLLVLRDQELDDAAFTAFARCLGVLDVYPFAQPLPHAPYVVAVTKEAQDVANFGGAWHSDTAYLPRPPGLTLLYALEVPRHGGDTLFADMYGAYESLSADLKARLASLQGHNTATLVHDSQGSHSAAAGESVARRDAQVTTQADHPLIRLHPETGRRALYFSLIHTANIVGMTREKSLPLLRYLQAHTSKAENLTRLQWQRGTLAIWDNRCVQHYPQNDYPGARREMHRIIVAGEPPIGVG
jgi:taurine dioxygenase